MAKEKKAFPASEGGKKASCWSVDEELVKRVARVSRLELSEKELEDFTGQLKGVLEAFKKIDEVDTDGVEPAFHPQPLADDWREDEVRTWKWDPLGNTKHKEGRHFKGPRIV